MTARTSHKFFTASGITARLLIFAASKLKEPNDMIAAAAFGIVELLGAKRFYRILGKAVKHQVKEQLRAYTHAKRRAAINPANKTSTKG